MDANLKKNILVIGNFCSSNRGDAAIMDGLIKLLGNRFPEYELKISSYYPEVAEHFHRIPATAPLTVVPDTGFAIESDDICVNGNLLLNNEDIVIYNLPENEYNALGSAGRNIIERDFNRHIEVRKLYELIFY